MSQNCKMQGCQCDKVKQMLSDFCNKGNCEKSSQVVLISSINLISSSTGISLTISCIKKYSTVLKEVLHCIYVFFIKVLIYCLFCGFPNTYVTDQHQQCSFKFLVINECPNFLESLVPQPAKRHECALNFVPIQ